MDARPVGGKKDQDQSIEARDRMMGHRRGGRGRPWKVIGCDQSGRGWAEDGLGKPVTFLRPVTGCISTFYPHPSHLDRVCAEIRYPSAFSLLVMTHSSAV